MKSRKLKSDQSFNYNVDDFYDLQKAVHKLLYNTLAAGNGGYVVNFGPVLFGRLAKLTNYDTNKRKK